ncbi:MAG: hypothetical protein U0414_05600 [Polyangiaceae bacterium]
MFDHGVNEMGFAYIVMELLEGEDLGTRLARRGALPVSEVATIIAQSAKALSKAHARAARSPRHRRQHLLMDVDGELFVKVLDFGVAKRRPSRRADRRCRPALMMATPTACPPPEQMANAKNAVAQSDPLGRRSCSVVAYEAMSATFRSRGDRRRPRGGGGARGHGPSRSTSHRRRR